MTEPNVNPEYDKSYYAVVDLGSNSFHLAISQLTDHQHLKITNRVKEKVRLAAGLTAENLLTDEAIERGLICLHNFARHLATIPSENIIIVATAALRIARNNDEFINKANIILPKKIQLLTGEQEASTIYAGVVYTDPKVLTVSTEAITRLVLDIGGASTEIVVGEGAITKNLVSLNIGCVSYIHQHFADGLLSEHNFKQCIAAASSQIASVSKAFKALNWQSVLGRSGTMQAMVEILSFQKRPSLITLPFLYEIKATLVTCKTLNDISIDGMRCDRAGVLASGLCILIALFNELNIKEMQLSTGALREGLLSQLLPNAHFTN